MAVKMLFMDIDGTLTDGRIYVGNTGEIMKRFDVKDGYAIHNILPQMGIIPVVITGRKSRIVIKRCREIGIHYLIQGCTDKASMLRTIIKQEHIGIEETAYIGDDMNDYECMSIVGVSGCPNDAVDEIKNLADYVTRRKGGQGAVREFIEWLRKQNQKEG